MAAIRKHSQNVIIDSISFACMVILAVTGILLHFRLPHGSHNSTILGLTRHQWGEFHFWVAMVFVAGIIVHSLLHLPWIKSVIYPKDESRRRKAVLIFSLGIYALLIFTFVILMVPIYEGASG